MWNAVPFVGKFTEESNYRVKWDSNYGAGSDGGQDYVKAVQLDESFRLDSEKLLPEGAYYVHPSSMAESWELPVGRYAVVGSTFYYEFEGSVAFDKERNGEHFRVVSPGDNYRKGHFVKVRSTNGIYSLPTVKK